MTAGWTAAGLLRALAKRTRLPAEIVSGDASVQTWVGVMQRMGSSHQDLVLGP